MNMKENKDKEKRKNRKKKIGPKIRVYFSLGMWVGALDSMNSSRLWISLGMWVEGSKCFEELRYVVDMNKYGS